MFDSKQAAMSWLLDKKCCNTGEQIKPGDQVAVHDWGMTDRILTYGFFEWSPEDRKFFLMVDSNTNAEKGLQFSDISDDDLWKAPVSLVSKLNP